MPPSRRSARRLLRRPLCVSTVEHDPLDPVPDLGVLKQVPAGADRDAGGPATRQWTMRERSSAPTSVIPAQAPGGASGVAYRAGSADPPSPLRSAP